MPNHLEYIVRPSQSPAIRPGAPTQIFQTPLVPNNTPITWGSSGESVFDLRATQSSNIKPATFPESDRQYDVVRVSNANDTSQSVDVEVMTQFNGRNALTGDKISLQFAKTQASDTTQIISQNNSRVNPANPPR